MILSVDIGGTAVKLGAVSEEGTILLRREVPAEAAARPLQETALLAAGRLMSEENLRPSGVAVSATGQIDSREGSVIGTNGKIPGYEGAPLRLLFEERFSLPTAVLNDANAAALGECFCGAGKGADPVLMVTLGTGVGSAIVLRGSLFLGMRGIAGEFGQFPLFTGRGGTGWYEEYASTGALVRRAERATGEKKLDGREVFARAAEGDAVMRTVISDWIEDVALGLVGFVHAFNPQCVIIGGGVSGQKTLLLEPLRKRVLSGVLPRFAEGLKIVPASLGNDAGLIGAARFWMEEFR